MPVSATDPAPPPAHIRPRKDKFNRETGCDHDQQRNDEASSLRKPNRMKARTSKASKAVTITPMPSGRPVSSSRPIAVRSTSARSVAMIAVSMISQKTMLTGFGNASRQT